MKIVYIPITIPWNVRSFFSFGIALICAVMIGVSLASTDWYHAAYQLSPVIANPSDPIQVDLHKYDIDRVTVKLGPWKLTMEICGNSKSLGAWACHEKQNVFEECRRRQREDLARFGSEQEDAFRGFDWCSGYKMTLASFGLFAIACILLVLNILLSFIWERCHGVLCLICLVITVVAMIMYADGALTFMNEEFTHLEEQMRTAGGQHTVSRFHRPGAAIIATTLGIIGIFFSTCISLSLFCCPPKNWAERNKNRPRIQIVTTDRSSRSGPMPVAAPQPGFQSIDANNEPALDYNGGNEEGDQEMAVTNCGGRAPPNARRRHQALDRYAETSEDRPTSFEVQY